MQCPCRRLRWVTATHSGRDIEVALSAAAQGRWFGLPARQSPGRSRWPETSTWPCLVAQLGSVYTFPARCAYRLRLYCRTRVVPCGGNGGGNRHVGDWLLLAGANRTSSHSEQRACIFRATLNSNTQASLFWSDNAGRSVCTTPPLAWAVLAFCMILPPAVQMAAQGGAVWGASPLGCLFGRADRLAVGPPPVDICVVGSVRCP